MYIQAFFDNFAVLVDTPNGVSKLRKLSLQLAFEGRLSTRNALDEPAAALVARAKAEKAKNDNQTRGNKEELGSNTAIKLTLPEGWVSVGLGEVTNIVRGITFPGSEKAKQGSNGKVACLRTTNVQDSIRWDDLIYVSDKYVRHEAQWVGPGDILISMANSYELVGKVAQVKTVPYRATFGGFLAAIRTYEVDQAYLIYLLRSPLIQQAFRRSSSQTTNIANISLGGIRPLPIPIAPLEEQRRIVATLDEVMRLCDELELHQQARRKSRMHLNDATLGPLNKAALLSREQFEQATTRLADNFDLLYDSIDSVPKLRSTILQLAVQGKLVPQNLHDEPAPTFLEKIRLETAQLLKNKEIKKTEALPPIRQEEIEHAIPETWCWARLSDLCQLITDGTHQTPKIHRNRQNLLVCSKCETFSV